MQRNAEKLEGIAKTLTSALESSVSIDEIKFEVIKNKGKCGGGTTPNIQLDTFAVAITHPQLKAGDLFYQLLNLDKPIVGILKEGQFIIDTLCLEDNDIQSIAEAINKTLCSILL